MTARKAGGLAAAGVWVTLQRLRDRWMLLAFAAGMLFWARDVYDSFVDLPARVAALGQEIGELRSDVERIGAGHAVGDWRPGDPAPLDAAPLGRLRLGCRDGALVAVVVDADGAWHPVETGPGRPPH